MTVWPNSENDQSDTPTTDAPRVHLQVLLDRSGSMASIAEDVIGGFNTLLAEQQAQGDDALLTLVQFDSVDPFEILVDAVPLREVTPLDAATFTPRGGTPLLDATARFIAAAAAGQARRAAAGGPPEEMILVSITDGHENSSVETSLAAVRTLIDRRSAEGWTFVFLSAALDVYGESGSLGYDPRSAQAWSPDAAGTKTAFESLSLATTNRRAVAASGGKFDKDDFFNGDKAAERQRRRKDR